MSVQTVFIVTFFISIVLSFFSFFEKELSSEVPISKPIIIEPIVIPKSVKEESNDEILEKLKLVTKEAFENAEPSEEEVAEEVLVILKSFVKVIESEKKKELARKKKQEEKHLKKKIELKKKKKTPIVQKKINPPIVKHLKEDDILLEKQQNIYTLPREEEESFKNIEVFSTLEERPEIKSPKATQTLQKEIDLEELPLVETLGVINVSKPFLKQEEF